MQRSTERILTTHVGSLPRPDDLFELMLTRMDGNAIDEEAYAERVREAVRDCVRQQVDAGEERPAADRRRLRKQPHERQAGCTLAAAGLADDPEHLARSEREREPVDRVHRALLGVEPHREVAHLEHRIEH